jgi:hypothetical protein
MLLITGAIVVLIAVGLLLRIRVSGGSDANKLGWMSEQWLAEQRVLPPR